MNIQQNIIYKKIFVKNDKLKNVVYIDVCDLDQMFIKNQNLVDSCAYKNAELKINDNVIIIKGNILSKQEYFPNFWYLKDDVFDIINGDYGYFENIEKNRLTLHGFEKFIKFKDYFAILKNVRQQIRFIPICSSEIIFNKLEKI